MTDIETRVCSACGTEKPLTDYYRQKNVRSGYMAKCIACNNTRRPTVARIIRNRARNRAYAALVERHREEFDQLLTETTAAAQAEHERLAAEAAAKGNHDAQTARIRPGPKREGETSTLERLDVARCPNCQTHHDADHQCPGCGAFTPKESNTPTLMGTPTPPYAIREWAYRNGIACAPRGPIPKDIVARFANANRRMLTIATETEASVADLVPEYDEAAVRRALDGDRSVALTKADRVEIVRRARARGLSLRDIEHITGITKAERYLPPRGGAA